MFFHDEPYQFLSNFYYVDIYFGGIKYPSVENVYQAQKVMPEYREYFTNISPAQAKKVWKNYPQAPNWHESRNRIMFQLLVQKFSKAELKQKLLAIDEDIVEDNYWHDNYWGNCQCTKCQNIQGQNVLGRLLMTVRELARLEVI